MKYTPSSPIVTGSAQSYCTHCSVISRPGAPDVHVVVRRDVVRGGAAATSSLSPSRGSSRPCTDAVGVASRATLRRWLPSHAGTATLLDGATRCPRHRWPAARSRSPRVRRGWCRCRRSTRSRRRTGTRSPSTPEPASAADALTVRATGSVDGRERRRGLASIRNSASGTPTRCRRHPSPGPPPGADPSAVTATGAVYATHRRRRRATSTAGAGSRLSVAEAPTR